MKNIYTLEDITSEYSVAIVDTCVLSRSFGKDVAQNPEKKRDELIENHEFRKEMMRCLEIGFPIFITELVYEEYLNKPHYDYKKALKKIDRRKDRDSKLLKKVARQIRDAEREERKLISMFKDMESILKFDENEKDLYDTLYEKYLTFKGEQDLSEADYDILISGIVTGQTRGFPAILSNDSGIINAWRDFKNREGINSQQFGFFIRQNNYEFERLD